MHAPSLLSHSQTAFTSSEAEGERKRGRERERERGRGRERETERERAGFVLIEGDGEKNHKKKETCH